MVGHPVISVIIPFFRVAPFIERCAEALMNQTLEDAEFIFVDDASPDESREILEQVLAKYPQRNARIVTHEVNKGLPAARNTGLAVAKGEFIYHCDSDDWPETTMLEKMHAAAEDNQADFIYCDFWMQFEKSARYMGTPDYTDPEQMIKEGFLAGAMKYNVWNKLVKHDLYEKSGVRFPDGHGMGEDMTMILLATHAICTARVPEALYHYVKLNANAFSNTFSERHLTDIQFNTDRTLKGLESWEVSDKDLYINLFKLNIKLPFLFSEDKKQYKLWKEWFPEANSYVQKNRHLPFRTRLVQWFAAKGLFPLVSLYEFLVNKVYYRLKFRDWKLDNSITRFILVGIANTLFGTTIMFVFYNLFHMGYWISSASNYFFGSILSYFLNKSFTFKYGKTDFKSICRFTINIVSCYLLAYGIAKPLAKHMLQGYSQSIQENLAMLAGMVIFIGFNYLGQRFFAFRKESNQS